MPILTHKKILFNQVSALFLSCFLTTTVAYSENSVSLNEAIQTALEKNPRTQANALRLQAAFENVQASTISAYTPRVTLNYSQTFRDDMSFKNGSASVNINLFNGFSDYYRLQAQTCQYKRLEANYNSTTTLIENTSGQIAGLVSSFYLSLLNTRENIRFFSDRIDKLKKLMPFAKTNEQKVNIENALNSLEINLEEIRTSLKIDEANYEYVVNDKAPANLDNLDLTIQKISIPASSEEAFQISLEKSPEILTARLSLQCQQLSQKAARAQLNGVRVDLSLGQSTQFMGSSQNTATIVVSKSLDWGSYKSASAEDTDIRATELDLDGTKSEIQNSINGSYIDLIGSNKAATSYTQSFLNSENRINNYMNNLNTLSTEDITILVTLLNTSQGKWFLMNSKKQEVINLKFRVQKTIGTLFESNNLLRFVLKNAQIKE